MEWIWIVLLIIIWIVAMKVLKKLFKWVMIVIFIIGLIFSYYAFRDMADFQSAEKLVLYEKDQVVAGFYGNLQGESRLLNNSNFAEYSDYENSDFPRILIVKPEAFDIQEIDFEGDILDREYVETLMDSDNPLEMYAAKYDVEISNLDDKMFKSLLFGTMFQEALEQDPRFVFTQHKQDNLVLIPETISFRTIKKVPLMDKFLR